MDRIKQLATRFRNAIESVQRNEGRDKVSLLTDFPNGTCGITCCLLGHYLLKEGIKTYYVSGNFHSQSHAWLNTDNGVFIDITADQFKRNKELLNFDIPVYVGYSNDFHDLFKVIDKRESVFLDKLGAINPNLYFNLYNQIEKYL